jgi:hypothetical protein
VTIEAASLPYRLVSPSLRTVGSREVLTSPWSLATTMAYAVFSALPRGAQHGVVALRARLRRARGFAHVLGQLPTESECRFVRRAAADAKPDLVLYDTIFNHCAGVEAPSQWIVTHDVMADRVGSLAKRGFGCLPRSFTPEVERTILAVAGKAIAIQPDDAAALRRLVPNARVVTVPVSFDVHASVRAGRTVPGRCIFVGSGALPNADGIRWFLEECWPLVRARVANATLDVCGTVCLRVTQAPAGVRLLGLVERLEDAYAEATLALAPLRVGSGLKVKVVEALSYGLPVVTTSVGAQGFDTVPHGPLLVADGAEAFAEAVATVLADQMLAERLSRAAEACAERYTPAHVFDAFEAEVLRDLGGADPCTLPERVFSVC